MSKIHFSAGRALREEGNTVSFSTKEALAELDAILGNDRELCGMTGVLGLVISTKSPDAFPLRNRRCLPRLDSIVEGLFQNCLEGEHKQQFHVLFYAAHHYSGFEWPEFSRKTENGY